MYPLATIEAEIAAAEAGVPNIRDGCAKQIVWADEPGVHTDISVVFIHGFSASPEELRPLPDLVAKALGANLFFTRLMGHGQDGAAMGRAKLIGWRVNMAEALSIGAVLGDRVLLIGCSTGCTLIADALVRGTKVPVMGACMISPNFGLRHRLAQFILDMPWSHVWGPWIAGAERTFPVESPEHGKYWTTRYPTKAVKPMGEAIRAVRRADLGAVKVPLLNVVNPDDQVIDPAKARATAARWGGPTEEITLVQTPQDHSMGHIMAGDVFSPGQTVPLANKIGQWAKRL